MKKYVASILSEGNHLFQASITILDNGVKVRIPGFWKNNETLLSFDEITGIELDTPSIIGAITFHYTTIQFYARGIYVKAHGFSKSDAKQIKQDIEDGKRGISNNLSNKTDSNRYRVHEDIEFKNMMTELAEIKKEKDEHIIKETIPKCISIITNTKYHIMLLDVNKENYNSEINKHNKTLNDALYHLKKMLKLIYGESWENEFEKIIEKSQTDADKKFNQYWENIESSVQDYIHITDDVNTKNNAHNISNTPEFTGSINLNATCTIIINSYDKLDVDVLENNIKIEEFRVNTDNFLKKIITPKGRKKLLEFDLSDEELEDDSSDQYIIALKNFTQIIDWCCNLYENEFDKEYREILPFAFYKEKFQKFFIDKSISRKERLSKLIDLVDNFVNRIDSSIVNKS